MHIRQPCFPKREEGHRAVNHTRVTLLGITVRWSGSTRDRGLGSEPGPSGREVCGRGKRGRGVLLKKGKKRKEFPTTLTGVYSQGDWGNCPQGEVGFASSQIHSMSVRSSQGVRRRRTTLQVYQKAQGSARGHGLNTWFERCVENKQDRTHSRTLMTDEGLAEQSLSLLR